VVRDEFQHGSHGAFVDEGSVTLEQTLSRAVNQYEDYLDENPRYEPPNISRALSADMTRSLEVTQGSLVAEQFRYPADRTEEQTAYLLKRFYDSREAWQDFTPARDAAKQATYWGVGATAAFTTTTGLSWQGIALGGFAAITAAGYTYLRQQMNPRDRVWLENKTLDDIDRTAAYIRKDDDDGPAGGDRTVWSPTSPDGTNVYNPRRTPTA